MIQIKSGNIILDAAESVKYLFSATDADYDDPAKISTAYTKTISFVNSKTNNEFFGKLNYEITTAVKRKYDNIQITNNGIIIDCGYLILDNVDVQNKTIKYNCTFYSNLGLFFNNLKTNSSQTRSLVDLKYKWLDEDLNEINEDARLCMWNSDYIYNSWELLQQSIDEEWYHNPTKRLYENLTAAPCYSGQYDDFDSTKLLTYKPTDSIKQSFSTATSQNWNDSLAKSNNWALFEMPRELDEWEVKDLRSLYQRPAIRTAAILNAISDAENNGGFKVNWPKDVKKNDSYLNSVYNKTWVILPRINFKDQNLNKQFEYELTLSPIQQDLTKVNKDAVSAYVLFNDQQTIDTTSLTTPKADLSFYINVRPDSTFINKIKQFDGDNEITWAAFNYSTYRLGGAITSEITNTINEHIFNMIEYIIDIETTAGYTITKKIIVSNGKTKPSITTTNGYTQNPYSTYYDFMNEKWFAEHTYYDTQLVYNTATGVFQSTMPITLSIDNIPKDPSLKIKITQNFYSTNLLAGSENRFCLAGMPTSTPYDGSSKYLLRPIKISKNNYFTTYIYNPTIVSTLENNTEKGTDSQIYDTIKSSVQPMHLSKSMLLSKTCTPLQFLLDFCRINRLKITMDPISNEVNIMKCKDYYKNTVNIHNYIDRSKQITIKPTSLTKRIYNFSLPSKNTYVEYLYNQKNNKTYGQTTIVNNNLSDSIDVFGKTIFNTTGDYKMTSPYFKAFLPRYYRENASVLKFGTMVTAKLFKDNELATDDYNKFINDNVKYDSPLALTCLFDKDDKATGDNFNLVFMDAFINIGLYKMIISDNLPIMYELNEKPCYYESFGSNSYDEVLPSLNSTQTIKLKSVGYLPYFTPFHIPGEYIMIDISENKHDNVYTSICSNMFNNGSTDKNILTSDESLFTNYYALYNDLNHDDCYEISCYVLLDAYKSVEFFMRQMYEFDGCLWVMNKIQDYDVSKKTTCKCTFIKVLNKLAYA